MGSRGTTEPELENKSGRVRRVPGGVTWASNKTCASLQYCVCVCVCKINGT